MWADQVDEFEKAKEKTSECEIEIESDRRKVEKGDSVDSLCVCQTGSSTHHDEAE